jgi:hypothetical protein
LGLLPVQKGPRKGPLPLLLLSERHVVAPALAVQGLQKGLQTLLVRALQQ